jgi:ergothioneine biosynthesis protein EgtB
MPEQEKPWSARFRATRAWTDTLSAPLSAEDQQLQAMPDASPVKWHRAHTTWFFDTFLLAPRGRAVRPEWGALFNSYYEALGPRHTRAERGLLSRPSAEEVGAYRAAVDRAVLSLLSETKVSEDLEVHGLLALGIAHEQQHQELILTDLLAAFAKHPLKPVYAPLPSVPPCDGTPLRFHDFAGGRVRVGAAPEEGFSFDNEGPVHEVVITPFAFANRLVTVREWCAFADDRGYETPSLWLSEGLDWVRAQGIAAPAYLRREGERVYVFGLHGERLAHPDEPVLHLSYYEADAIATWLGARLPSEHEWEIAARDHEAASQAAQFVTQPLVGEGLLGLYGVGWQWTRSSYEPYPRFRAASGAIGEYNGKFMINQRVLRGSSLFTPSGHSRRTYRNFWHPDTRFQATSLRLAKDM